MERLLIQQPLLYNSYNYILTLLLHNKARRPLPVFCEQMQHVRAAVEVADVEMVRILLYVIQCF